MFSKNATKFYQSICFKITVWYSVSIFIILITAGGFLYFRLTHKLNKEVNLILFDESGEVLQDIMEKKFTQNSLKDAIEMEASDEKYFKVSARVLDMEQNTLITSANFFAPDLKISERSIGNAEKGTVTFDTIRVQGRESPYRLITRPVYLDNSLKYLLQVAIYLKPTQKIVENLEENFAMLIPVLTIITVLCGWLIAKRSLAPIKGINKMTQTITASNLSKRLHATHTGDELDTLTGTINNMLDRLENSFKRTRQFSSDASHELRTPIASLKTGIEVTLSKNRTTEEYCVLLINNLRVLERMTRLVNDLLELSRTDSDVNVLDMKLINLADILKDQHEKFMLISESRNIKILMNEVPDMHILGDEALLRRLFCNLLDNAVKYTSSGDHVTISLEERGREIFVRIEDTGIGIPETDLEKIFDRFFRVDPSRTRETGGSGLGLSICKNIVALHRGTIGVESKINSGTTVTVHLPRNHPQS
ncbi:MAG: heavy metal sensor histidine kinase [Candidatus Scalindua sp.]|nr:heavy metal sensor histidine kinase [Candidatus Scalindua sp.]